LRVENIADRFDKSATTQTFDVLNFAKTFFYDANKNSQYDLSKVQVEEVSLSNNWLL